MFRYITILLFIGITTASPAQSSNVQDLPDSLFQNWQDKNNSVANRIDNLHDYIWKAQLFVNPDSAEVLARQLVHFCDENDNLQGKSKGLNTLAVSYAIRSNYEKAIEVFQQNVEIYQEIENPFRLAKAYNNIGNCYHEQDLFYHSLDYFNKALLVFDGILDTCSQAVEENVRLRMDQTYAAVISTYIGLDELDKARTIYEKTIKNIDKINKEMDASSLYQLSASLELKSGNPEKLLEEVNKSIKVARQFNNKQVLGLSLWIKSKYYSDKNDLDTVIQLVEEAELIFQEIKDVKNEVTVKLLLIDAFIKKNELEKAIKNLKSLDKLVSEKGLDFAKSDIYKAYSDYYTKVGNIDKAYVYLKQYHILDDSIQQDQNDKLLTSLEDKYAYESQLLTQALKIENEKKNTKITGIVLLIVLAFAILLAFLSIRLFRLNRALKDQKEQLLKKQNELNESLERLEESNENLQQFAGAAAHDLKGPLRTISSFTNLINRKYGNLVKPEDTEYFDFILRGTKTMQELINGLLQYSSISNKTFEVEAVDLNAVFQDIIFSLDANIEEANAKINIPSNLPISEGQYSLLFQVFSNLVNNAIKFRKEETPLVININSEIRANSDYHIISIQDNGIGIQEEHQKDVFKVFEKLHHVTQYEGVGLGLSLSKKIIERLAGEIWLESEFGTGTTLFVKLKKAS